MVMNTRAFVIKKIHNILMAILRSLAKNVLEAEMRENHRRNGQRIQPNP